MTSYQKEVFPLEKIALRSMDTEFFDWDKMESQTESQKTCDAVHHFKRMIKTEAG